MIVQKWGGILALLYEVCGNFLAEYVICKPVFQVSIHLQGSIDAFLRNGKSWQAHFCIPRPLTLQVVSYTHFY
jgi:hypothetical protein